MKRLQFFVFMIYVSITSLPSFAGDQTDNPGELYAQEFKQIGKDIADFLKKEPMMEIDEVKLWEVVQKTQVETRPSLEKNDGNEVDALNFPNEVPPRILLSEKSWSHFKDKHYRKVFLVLHEYLGIMGVDDSNYSVSTALDRARVCSRSPKMKNYLEKLFRKTCYRFLPDDLLYVDANEVAFYLDSKEVKKGDFFGMRIGGVTLWALGGELLKLPKSLFWGIVGLPQLSILGDVIIEKSSFEYVEEISSLKLKPWHSVDGKYKLTIQDNAFDKLEQLNTLTFILPGSGRMVDLSNMSKLNLEKLPSLGQVAFEIEAGDYEGSLLQFVELFGQINGVKRFTLDLFNARDDIDYGQDAVKSLFIKNNYNCQYSTWSRIDCTLQ